MISTEIQIDLKSPVEFHKFLQKECYEEFLLDILNQFKTFNHDFVKIEN